MMLSNFRRIMNKSIQINSEKGKEVFKDVFMDYNIEDDSYVVTVGFTKYDNSEGYNQLRHSKLKNSFFNSFQKAEKFWEAIDENF